MGLKGGIRMELTRGSVTIEQYQNHYGFTTVSLDGMVDELEWTKKQFDRERGKKRRQFYQERIKEIEIMINLSVEPISLNISKAKDPNKDFAISPIFFVPDDTYIGGLEEELSYKQNNRFQKIDFKDSLYIGQCPDWVWEKYVEGKKVFGIDNIFVLSKNRDLFRHTMIIPKISPLLIGYMNGVCYLLAAWGLENELPKNLGGVLEETGNVPNPGQGWIEWTPG